HHFFTPVPDLTLVRDDLPAHLLDVVRRALNKDPDRRFKATRDMLTAIEATAFSERDRQKSERTLQHLVQGRAVRKITTHALPPPRPVIRRAAPPTGRLRLLTTPTTASIWIDGRRVGTGSVYDEVPISPGARHLEVRAPGYETFDTTVVIEAGGTLSLKRVTL